MSKRESKPSARSGSASKGGRSGSSKGRDGGKSSARSGKGGGRTTKTGARGGKSGGRSKGRSTQRGGGRRKGSAARRPPKRSWGRRLLKWFVVLSLLGALAGVGVLVGGYWYFARGLPDFERIEDWRPAQTTRIRAADGAVIAELFRERRTLVGREAIPDVIINAVLSAEDADFYRHEGLDYTGMLRALYNSVRAGRITGSGSTITQQTVKNLLLSPEKRFERKAKEIILSRRLEDRLSKDDILTIYLNAIYLGHGRYGVAEAVKFYYGHNDLHETTLAQAAALAGLISSPERLSPRKHPERSLKRRTFVLRMMVKNGHITQAEADAAIRADLELAEPDDPFVPEAQWFVDRVRKILIERYGEDRAVAGGLDVRTSLDLGRQRIALDALRGGLRAVDARQGYRKPRAKVPGKDAAQWRARRARRLKNAPPPPGVAARARIKAIEGEAVIVEFGVGEARLDAAELARFTADDAEGQPYAVGDVIAVRVRADGPQHPEQMRAVPAGGPQGALVVLDPQSRHVLALVGGYSHGAYPFDRTTQARRQPGSAFKPFVWGAALASKQFTMASTLIDAPETLRVHRGKFWQPKNYTRKFRGPVSLQVALAHSINSVAVNLAESVGVPAVQDFARRAGLTSPLADGLAMSLGASEVYPLELANAYATVAANGRFLEPRFILSVEDRDGVVEVAESSATEALDPAVTWILREVMRAVVTEGSGRRLKGFARPVVGKTGTSNEARDAWFVGLLPEVVTAAWVGFDTPRSLGKKEAGGRTAVPVVKAYLEAAEAEGPDWPPPPEGVEVRRIVADGRLAPPGSEQGVEAYFLTGTAPTEVAPAEGEVDANSIFFEDVAPTEEPSKPAAGGPSLAVPSVGVAPLPDTLRPLKPATARPAPEQPDDDGGDAPRLQPIDDDEGETPQLKPIDDEAGDPEDLPP